MRENNVKKSGFTLLETIVSFGVISIISVGIYTGYAIMIKQTKDAQVKQAAALEAKKSLEALESSDFTLGDSSITVKNMTFNKDNTDYKRYLNKDYKDMEDDGNRVPENTAKYIESVTFVPSTALPVSEDTTNEAVTLNPNNNSNSEVDKIYISRMEPNDYISYWKYDKNNSYNPKTDENIKGISLSGNSKMQLFLYITPISNDTSNENINIVDYTGKNLITEVKKISDNLVINFNNYKKADGTLPSGENIEIDVYNQTSTTAKIYLEKQTDLNVDLENRQGEVNLYNNRAQNIDNDIIGSLYDIKISITDTRTNTELFTGYYKKSLVV